MRARWDPNRFSPTPIYHFAKGISTNIHQHTYPSKALTHDYSDFYATVKESYQKRYAISKNIEKIFYKSDFLKQKITSKKITKTPFGEEKTGGLLFI